MDFFTTLITTIALASAIAYNSDTADATFGDDPVAQPTVVSEEVPPPAPPPSDISFE